MQDRLRQLAQAAQTLEQSLGRAPNDAELAKRLEELPARHAEVVRMRFGLDGDPPRTLQAITQKLSLSRERVRVSTEVRNQRLPLTA